MSDKDCLFCKIIAGEIPSEKVYAGAITTYAFKDINPKAKVHVLVVPLASIMRTWPSSRRPIRSRLAHMAQAAQNIADKEFHGAFRLIFNTGLDAGQTRIPCACPRADR